jgi:hypothetical protein
MSEVQYCQFKTLRNTQCRHHMRPETPIRFSPILGLYLCDQHERFIIEDHINQFIKARFLHQNLPIDEQNSVYDTFSQSVIDRFISREHIEHIPLELYTNQCLYVYYALDYTHEVSTNILFYIRNEYLHDLRIGSCQIGSKHDAENCVKTDISQFLIRPHNQSIRDYLDKFIEDTQIYFTQFLVYIPEPTLSIGLQSLRTQFEQETNRIQLGLPDIDIEEETQNIIEERDIIEEQTIVDIDNGRISPISEPEINEDIVNVSGSPPRITHQTIHKLEITTIDFCNICVLEEEQRGFRMSCCNSDNTICLDCVINHQLLVHTRFYSVLDIKDMNIFNQGQSCFFCRSSNSLKDIINDNEFKDRFVNILQTHIQKEFKEREQNHLTQIRSRLGLL